MFQEAAFVSDDPWRTLAAGLLVPAVLSHLYITLPKGPKVHDN